MAFNIQEFLSQGLPFNGARPTQFKINITPPTILRPGSTKLQYVCKAATVPPEIMGIVEQNYFGRTTKLSGDREFPDWTVQILVDGDYFGRTILEQWSQLMNGHVDNLMAANVYPIGYKATAEVIQYRQDGTTIKTYTLYGLFPAQVDPISLSWDDKNQIEVFDCTFSYDYWISKNGDNLAVSSSDGTQQNPIINT